MSPIEIPYGKEKLRFELPPSNLQQILTVLPANRSREETDLKINQEAALVAEALSNPVGSAGLSELAAGKERILVITSDQTRPMPSRITLPLLLEEIRKGSPGAKIRILIASGMHRAMTREEMEDRFGGTLLGAEEFLVHDSRKDDCVLFGKLPSGGELWLNAQAVWAQLIVAEGFIEPHFFAGFSGGRKSILPGIASHRTIMWNHNAAFIADPHAIQGSLSDNPIHRDMAYAAEKAKLGFILNVLLDENKKIRSAYAGDPAAAHEKGCRDCLEHAAVYGEETDIVITSNGGYPLDQNLYQCVKGMTAAEPILREGGVLILCAALYDGCGGDAFYHWFADRENAATVLRDIQDIPAERTIPDQWQAQILARILCRFTVIIVTETAHRSLIEQMHMQWAPSLEEALKKAFILRGEEASLTVIPNGVDVLVRRKE